MSEPLPTEHSASGTPAMSPIWLAIWAAADKGLAMLYGVASILLTMRVLDKDEWGAWTIFSVVFMVISMLGDFFILQPMVKIASENPSDPRPVITSSFIFYTIISLALGFTVALFSDLLAAIMKTPLVVPSFRMMGLLVLANIVRTHAIRVLQIQYRIVAIFFVDFIYFAGLIGLMIYGTNTGTLRTSTDMVDYNLIAFIGSSVLGMILAFRLLVPSFHDIGAATRRLLRLGLHQGGTGILTMLQQQSDVLIVSGIRGGWAAGVYGAARTFYRFFDSVRDAAQLLLVPATSRAYAQERIEAVEEITELATAAMVALMFPMTIGLIVLAPWLIPLVLPKFPEAIDEFQWLMANGFAIPFVIVPSVVLLGIGHTRDLFRGTLIGTAVLILAGLVLTWFFGAAGMAAGVFLGTTVTALLLTRRMNRYVRFTFGSVLRRSRGFGPLVRRRIAAFQGSIRRDGRG